MARPGGKVRRLTGGSAKEAVLNGGFATAFVRNWDKEPGAAQTMDRIDQRAKMGLKRTPIGAGVAKREGS